MTVFMSSAMARYLSPAEFSFRCTSSDVFDPSVPQIVSQCELVGCYVSGEGDGGGSPPIADQAANRGQDGAIMRSKVADQAADRASKSVFPPAAEMLERLREGRPVHRPAPEFTRRRPEKKDPENQDFDRSNGSDVGPLSNGKWNLNTRKRPYSLAYYRIFAPAFRRWIDRALDEKKLSISLLINFQRLLLVFESEPPKGFLQSVWKVQRALNDDFIAGYGRFKNALKDSPSSVSDRQMLLMENLAFQVSQGERLNRLDLDIHSYLEKPDSWQFVLRKARPAIIDLFETVRDRLALGFSSTAGPHHVVPLEIDFNDMERRFNIKLLNNFQRLSRVLAVNPRPDFIGKVSEVQRKLEDNFSANHVRFEKARLLSTQSVSNEQVRLMKDLVSQASEAMRLERIDRAILPYLEEADSWHLELREARSAIIDLFETVRDSPSFGFSIAEGPSRLGPLQLDFTGIKVDAERDFEILEAFSKSGVGNYFSAWHRSQAPRSQAPSIEKKEAGIMMSMRASLLGAFQSQPDSNEEEKTVKKIEELPLRVMMSMWYANSIAPGETMVELGSENSANLLRRAKDFPQVQLVGFEVADDSSLALQQEILQRCPHLRKLPDNARFVAIGLLAKDKKPRVEEVPIQPSDLKLSREELLAKFARKIIGRRKAAYVTHIQPRFQEVAYSEPMGGFNPWSYRSAELETHLLGALDLLRPGGVGILFTEHMGLLDRAIAILRRQPDLVESIAYSNLPFTGSQLEELGIVPRSPHIGEISSRSRSYDPDEKHKPFGIFNWAFPLVYRKL